MPQPLRIGDPAPDFEKFDQEGRTFKLSDHRGKCVVVFFYPRDHTPACTAQACAFRDRFKDFADAGAIVVGVSNGQPASHGAFAARHQLPFILIADDGSVRSSWGVPKTLWVLPGRVTYVLDQQGIVRHLFSSQLDISGHVEGAMEVVKRLVEESRRPSAPLPGRPFGGESAASAPLHRYPS
jgi:peroxiredoxin Q/BCP